MKKVLALDFGDKRIGVAASDPLGATAQPLAVIERASLAEDIARIGELARGGLADAEGRARDQNRGTVHCTAEALQVGNSWRIHERLDEFPSRANH